MHDRLDDGDQRLCHDVLAVLLHLGVDVVVGKVCAEVYAEPNAHDEVDERNAVEYNTPDGHEAHGADQGADDAEDGGQCGQEVGQQDQGDGDDDDPRCEDALERLVEDGEVLVDVQEVRVEDVGLEPGR